MVLKVSCKHELILQEESFTWCRSCGAIKIKGRWRHPHRNQTKGQDFACFVDRGIPLSKHSV